MENIAANRAVAARYARALFEVAVAEADPRAVERDLTSLVALFEENPVLRKALWNPAVPSARKVAAIGDIAQRGRLAAPLAKLLKLMAERDYLSLLPHLLKAYRRRLMDHLGIVQAEVTTAVPLRPEEMQALERELARATGKQVTMTAQVNAGIIGGVVTRLDSTVYDGSVVRQLERIRQKMTEEAGG